MREEEGRGEEVPIFTMDKQQPHAVRRPCQIRGRGGSDFGGPAIANEKSSKMTMTTEAAGVRAKKELYFFPLLFRNVSPLFFLVSSPEVSQMENLTRLLATTAVVVSFSRDVDL